MKSVLSKFVMYLMLRCSNFYLTTLDFLLVFWIYGYSFITINNKRFIWKFEMKNNETKDFISYQTTFFIRLIFIETFNNMAKFERIASANMVISSMLFSAIMKGLEKFYTTGDVVPTSSGRLPTSKTLHVSHYDIWIVLTLFIKNIFIYFIYIFIVFISCM